MLLMPALKKFKKRMDYSEYGGALLLGIKKPIVKCHGTANAKIVRYTLIQAENFAKTKVVETIEEEIKRLNELEKQNENMQENTVEEEVKPLKETEEKENKTETSEIKKAEIKNTNKKKNKK